MCTCGECGDGRFPGPSSITRCKNQFAIQIVTRTERSWAKAVRDKSSLSCEHRALSSVMGFTKLTKFAAACRTVIGSLGRVRYRAEMQRTDKDKTHAIPPRKYHETAPVSHLQPHAVIPALLTYIIFTALPFSTVLYCAHTFLLIIRQWLSPLCLPLLIHHILPRARPWPQAQLHKDHRV